MIHDMRWTSKKIAQRIETVEALVYRRKRPIGPFRYLELPGLMSPPPVGPDADDAGWQEIGPFTHWGKRYTDFVLRCEFAVPTIGTPTPLWRSTCPSARPAISAIPKP